jgi:hypothetical protein
MTSPSSRRAHRLTATIVALAFVGAACSGDTTIETSGSATLTDAPATASTDDTGEPAEPASDDTESAPYEITMPASLDVGEYADGSPAIGPTTAMSPEQAIAIGVDQGIWSEADGVTVALQWLAGDLDPDTVPVFAETRSRSYTGVVEIADQLLDGGELSDAQADRIRNLLDRVAPPLDVVESVATDDSDPTIGPEAQGFRGRTPARSIQAPSASCIALETGDFASLIAGDNCFAVKTYQTTGYPVVGYRLRVFHPPDWNGTPKEAVVQLALDAMVKTATTLDPWATVRDMSAVFSRPDPSGRRIENLGLARNGGTPDSECAITILPTVQGESPASFQQLVAHEAVHCVQFSDLGSNRDDWVIEGGAEYFSHFLYPQGGLSEDVAIDFDQASRTTALDDLSYEAWVWWQFLANRTSPQQVWELHQTLSNGSSIDAIPDVEKTFHEFVILWSGPGFPDSAGARLPYQAATYAQRPVITDSGDTALAGGAFVSTRWRVRYEQERRFVQQRSGDNAAEVAFVEFDERQDRPSWTELPTEIRSTCVDQEIFIVVATRAGDAHDTVLGNEVELGECDPCLLGTWRLDNPSLDGLIREIIADSPEVAQGPSFSFTSSGDYYLRFDEERQWDAWRTNYAVTVAAQGFEFVTSIASIERGSYGTSGDGTRLDIPESVTVESRTTSNIPGLGGSVTVGTGADSVTLFGHTSAIDVPDGDDGPQSATAQYVCDDDMLGITLDGYSVEIRFDRVEDIPEPPTKLPA